MSHAAPESTTEQADSSILPRPVRVAIYATATPIGAAAGVLAASALFGPVVQLVAGCVAAACTAAIGTTALANTKR